jgi:hypothetical protein
MEETEIKPVLTNRDIILRYGLIAGGCSVLYNVILYIIDPGLIFNPVSYLGTVGLMIIAIMAAMQRRKNNGGIITYGESVSTSLLVFTLGLFIYTVFYLVLVLVIDPALIAKMKSVTLERIDKLLETGFLDKKGYNEAVSNVEDMGPRQIITGSLSGLLIIPILSLIVFLISSIFVRKDSPFKNNPF